MKKERLCIYCNVREANSGEHYMPACLGNFRNFEQLYNKLCSECNRRIGELEEQFCRCGPVAFFRIIKGIKGQKHHKKVNPFYRGSAGGSRIVMETKHPDLDCMIYCEIEEGGENAFPARQIILRDSNGKYHSILITEKIKQAEHLRSELEAKGIVDAEIIDYLASPEEEEWIKRLCKGFIRRMDVKESSLSANIGDKKFVVTFRGDTKYFRAVAKIAFHYFLKNFKEFTGHEKEFDGIKHFIMNSGNPDQWVRQVNGSFIFGLEPGVTTDKYCHLLAVDKNEKDIRARLHFFVGPKEAAPHYYEVFIGENPGRIIHQKGVGHQFIYFDEPDKDGYDGRVDPLRPIRRSLLV